MVEQVAGCRPEECFFTDDIAENIAGAPACGFQAVQFHNRAQLTAPSPRCCILCL